MRQDIKNRWVRRLRDPATMQGKFRLNDGRGAFCCLGVLCDEVKADLGLAWTSSVGLMRLNIAGEGYFLPEAVAEYAELPHKPEVIDPNSQSLMWLTELNDSGGLSFNELADLIEAQL